MGVSVVGWVRGKGVQGGELTVGGGQGFDECGADGLADVAGFGGAAGVDEGDGWWVSVGGYMRGAIR